MTNNLKKIFVTGGAGYVGSRLVDHLLNDGYFVTVVDLMIFGDKVLKETKNLKIIRGDIRDIILLRKNLPGHDAVIHLACISNDPSFELNPELGKSINFTSFEPLVAISKDSGIKRFIYASSSSVYGIKNEASVHESMVLEPLTDYSKYKAKCEEILSKYCDKGFVTVTLRPATVCGVSPRQRLDVIVNILTNLAYHNRKITVFGGEQYRPNIHIDDMVRAYLHILKQPDELVANELFNVGHINQTVLEIASSIRSIIGDDVSLEKTPTNDPRSYHISSDKIYKKIGFRAKKTIEDAATDLAAAFKKGTFRDPLNNELFYNIKRMQSLKIK